MRQGPIQAEPRERLDDRAQRQLALWEKVVASAPAVEPPWRTLDSLGPAEWQTVLQGARVVVAACTSRHPEWMRQALAWSSGKSRSRTYLFGPEPWASSVELQALMKAGGSRLLTRLGSEPPADFLLADGERGWLVLGAPGEARRWLLPLGPGLARGLHEAFVHLFWQRARRESSPDARFKDCLPSPFPAPSEAGGRLACGPLVLGVERLEPLLPDAELVVEPQDVPEAGTPRLLLVPPSRDGFARLSERVGQGTEVAWFDAGLPRLALTRRRLVVELGEGPERLRLEFEAGEAIRMKNLLEARARAGAWRFYPARGLGEVRGPVRVEGASAEQPVHDELAVDLGDVGAAELLALDGVQPANWREPSALSRRVRYQWRVLPPRAPAEARSAKLLREWEQLDTHVEARASAVAGLLERMEREEGARGLLSRLTGLVSSWKGVNSRRKRLRNALDEVREQPLSRRPHEAARLVALLEDQERELTELEHFCQEQEAQAELRLAEETQRAEHARHVERARLEHGQLSAALEPLRMRLQETRAALPPLEARRLARAEEVLRAAREARTARARELLASVQDRLEEQTRRREALQEALGTLAKEAPQEERKRRKKELHSLDEALKRLRAESEAHRRVAEAPFQPGTERPGADEELAQLDTRLETSREEVAALEREEQRLCTERDAQARNADAPFHFRPPVLPARPGRKGVAHKPVALPREPLPEVGQLLEHGERRYLAVRTWAEASRAKGEADRLGATLVAMEP